MSVVDEEGEWCLRVCGKGEEGGGVEIKEP